MTNRITPIFLVLSIDEAIDFYESIGFQYDFHYHLDGDRDKPKIFAAMTWEDQTLHIQLAKIRSRNGAYLLHDDVRSLGRSLAANGIATTQGPPDDIHCIRELHVEDPWGNQLSFAEYPA